MKRIGTKKHRQYFQKRQGGCEAEGAGPRAKVRGKVKAHAVRNVRISGISAAVLTGLASAARSHSGGERGGAFPAWVGICITGSRAL